MTPEREMTKDGSGVEPEAPDCRDAIEIGRDEALADAILVCGHIRTSKLWGAHVAYDECMDAIAALRRLPRDASEFDKVTQAAALSRRDRSSAAESHLSHPPTPFVQWLEQRVALADAAIVAAHEVIGQCDCGMDEPPPNPKKAWHAARDAYWALLPTSVRPR